MALYFEADDPRKLLGEFCKAIKEGKIVTWSRDDDGDFTHTPIQWRNKAWLRPKIEDGQLSLYIVSPKNTALSSLAYAIYHGRFLESMLVHCDQFFTTSTATAMPIGSDNPSGN